jgi:membrane protease YdiL (CAAX protease family)
VPHATLTQALRLRAVGLTCLGPVAVLAWHRLPSERLPRPRWRGREVLAVVATPFALLPLLLLAHGQDVLILLALTQVQLGATAAVALGLAARRPEGLAALGLARAPTPRALGGAAVVYPALFLSLMGLSGVWQLALDRLGRPAEQDVVRLLLELERPQLFLAAPIVVLVGPFLEELLFRGFLQGVLAARLGDRVAIGITSVLFAGLHGLAPLPMLLGLALFLGWLQARTRSLLVPFAVHAVHNGLTLGLVLWASRMLESAP